MYVPSFLKQKPKISVKLNIRILLVIIALSLLATVFAQAQSDRRINRLSQETGLYIRIAVADTLLPGGNYSEAVVYCEEELVTHFINNRHFIAHSSKFQFDLDVKKRKVGGYNSWVTKDRDKDEWYFITPFKLGEGFGVIIQPISKSHQPMYDRPIVTIANVNICH